ncbi:UDP-3-O-(3-hydroxymyristoyl)glucosamine N-acyltransferase [Psychrobacter sp. HD31]|uniref:UDP-3-O-(3-hydroxymyristoyl)glucosamine N-acyltransferase n=1 Tax=Psychrobacter sp. HD31 TaxID=3112003 RepID=UPI003DA3CB93
MVTIAKLIEKIETRQPVMNKLELTGSALALQMQGFARLDKATSQQIGFLAQAKYAYTLTQSNAGVAIVTDGVEVPQNTVALVVSSPYLAYASCSQLFDTALVANIHPTANIADSAVIGKDVVIGAYASIGEHTKIGNGTQIAANVVIEEDCLIGKNCVIKPNVAIASQTQIGNDVRVHNGASIGSEGFGFAPTKNPADAGEQAGWERIVQLGRVIIGNHVRIGANTCIDRGAIDDTVIEDNVIIDNLVQIAHNVHIGAGSAIAANTGIAGSTRLGKRCIVAGAVGIAGHLAICDDVTITAMTMVIKSINQSGTYSSGIPVMPSNDWKRAVVHFRKSGKK